MARVLIVLLVSLFATGAWAGPKARTVAGVVEGVDRGGVSRFLSIPYAAPPTGERRWRAPAPVTPWAGVRQAVAFGPSCTQNISAKGWGPWTGEFSPQGAVSEDCLTLSVWTPALAPGQKAAVMLWLPGGGFTDGGEATAVYDGEALARQGIVVVTINYRVAAFGLLVHPALETEPDGGKGNLPLRDALAALQWVHANIAAFGGDPARVTVAGQSAGGALVYALLDAPQAAGLVAGAIVQSNPPDWGPLGDRAAAETVGLKIGAALGATDAAGLRAISPEQVLAAPGDDLNLFVDGVLIRDPRGASLPYLNDVPILTGVTAEEESFLKPGLKRHRDLVAARGEAFARLYPAADEAQARAAVLRSSRDRALLQLQRWSRAHADGGKAPVWLYLWDHALPGPDAALYGAFHSAEVPYMFGTLKAAPWRSFTARDRAISATMLGYWANFVKSGDPNGPGLPAWPRPGAGATPVMTLGDSFTPFAPLPDSVAAFWASQDAAERF